MKFSNYIPCVPPFCLLSNFTFAVDCKGLLNLDVPSLWAGPLSVYFLLATENQDFMLSMKIKNQHDAGFLFELNINQKLLRVT